MGAVKLFWIIGIIIVTTISGWIAGVRMRRTVRRTLHKEVADAELTSLSLWMKVEDAEERNRGGKLSLKSSVTIATLPAS
jgi:hypothetical protein